MASIKKHTAAAQAAAPPHSWPHSPYCSGRNTFPAHPGTGLLPGVQQPRNWYLAWSSTIQRAVPPATVFG